MTTKASNELLCITRNNKSEKEKRDTNFSDSLRPRRNALSRMKHLSA